MLKGTMPQDKVEILKERLKELTGGRERIECLIQLGDELRVSAPAEARSFFEQALTLARQDNQTELMARAALRVAEVLRMLGEVELSRKYAQQSLELSRGVGDHRLQGGGYYVLGTIHETVGAYDRAFECYHRALELWEQAGYGAGLQAVLNQLGNLAAIQGRYDAALDYYQRIAGLLTEGADDAVRAFNHYNLGWVLIQLGNWESGTENLYRAIALAEKGGNDYIRLKAINVLGELALKGNRLDRAAELFTQVVNGGRQGLKEVLRDGLINLGEVEFRRHNFAAARAAYQEALALCERIGDRLGLLNIHWRMAELELAGGDIARCTGMCNRARELAEELGAKKEEAEVERVRALLEAETGMDAAAVACFEKAQGLLADAPDSYEYARIQFQYGRFLVKQGRAEAGVVLLKRAAQVFRNLGVVAEADEINRILFNLELGVDRDMALLSAVSGLSTMGLDPATFLAECFKRMCTAWGCSGGAVVCFKPNTPEVQTVTGEPLLTIGRVNLKQAISVVTEGRRETKGSNWFWFPLQAGTGSVGGVFLEYEKEARSMVNPGVLGTIAALLLPAVERVRDFSLRVKPADTEIPNLRFSGVVGRSPAFRRALEIVARSADSSVPVLICGESGTGKELVARALHDSSARREKPFLAINCAAVPETLLEAEFFGVERGAATGVAARKGKFELANGGTVFLDEIGDMSPGLQAKLLRVLQEKEFEKVGGTKPIKVDVRIVAATNCDLPALIKEGKFRSDLYYRLKGVEVFLPPLRERKEDILEFVDYFIARANQETNRQVKGITGEVLECFRAYTWPGNIRELQNVIHRGVVLARGEMITVGDLPVELQSVTGGGDAPTPEDLRASRRQVQERAAAEVEKDLLVRCLEKAGGNVTEAAKISGYSRAQFYRLIKKHKISPKTYKRSRTVS